MDEVNKNAEIVFNYLKLNQKLESKADLILVFCSRDLSVADFAAELYNKGAASAILFSGGATKHKNSELTKTKYKTEADWFAAKAINLGVNPEDIFKEEKAENTGENVKFIYQLIQELKLKADRIIVAAKPYMARRSYATIKKQWPNKNTEFIIMCQDVSWSDYSKDLDYESLNLTIKVMVGDLERIIEYAEPEYNYQIYQEVPVAVTGARLKLIELGYGERKI